MEEAVREHYQVCELESTILIVMPYSQAVSEMDEMLKQSVKQVKACIRQSPSNSLTQLIHRSARKSRHVSLSRVHFSRSQMPQYVCSSSLLNKPLLMFLVML